MLLEFFIIASKSSAASIVIPPASSVVRATLASSVVVAVTAFWHGDVTAVTALDGWMLGIGIGGSCARIDDADRLVDPKSPFVEDALSLGAPLRIERVAKALTACLGVDRIANLAKCFAP